MPNNSPAIHHLFYALSDPTRLAVIEQLQRGEKSASELSAGSGMALPSFMQHLSVLEENGVVTSQKRGRRRCYALVPKGLSPAAGWLDRQRRLWEARLDRLDALLVSEKERKT